MRSLSGEDRITHSRTKHEEIGTSTASISRLLLCAKVREPPVDDLADDLDCHPGSPRSPLVDSACEWRSAARWIAEAAAAVRASCAMSLSLRSSLGSTPAIPWQLLVASGLACRKRLGVAERSGLPISAGLDWPRCHSGAGEVERGEVGHTSTSASAATRAIPLRSAIVSPPGV